MGRLSCQVRCGSQARRFELLTITSGLPSNIRRFRVRPALRIWADCVAKVPAVSRAGNNRIRSNGVLRAPRRISHFSERWHLTQRSCFLAWVSRRHQRCFDRSPVRLLRFRRTLPVSQLPIVRTRRERSILELPPGVHTPETKCAGGCLSKNGTQPAAPLPVPSFRTHSPQIGSSKPVYFFVSLASNLQ